MIKSPFKAIVICVLPDEKISKNPAFPADMITQGGYFDSGNNRIRIINYPIRFNLDIPVRVVTPHMADNSHKPTPVIITGYDRAVVNQSQELHIKVYNNSLISGIGCFWIAFGC